MSVKWTEVLSAFASVTSVCLSIIAAMFAYRGIRTAWRSLEMQRKQFNESVDLQSRKYAASFCVWLEEVDGLWLMMVHNAGDMPVYDAYVSWGLDDPLEWSGVYGKMRVVSENEMTGLSGEWDFGNVGPTVEPRCVDGAGEWAREGAAHCLAVLEERGHGLLFPPGFETAFKNIRLRTIFTDVAGVRWERRGGSLRCQDDWYACEEVERASRIPEAMAE